MRVKLTADPHFLHFQLGTNQSSFTLQPYDHVRHKAVNGPEPTGLQA
ncbi:hypothetical protein [Peribacillus muralis]|nr:hypothetical protein [Peribacillus muralis]